MTWIKHADGPIWLNPESGEMVVVYSPPNPRSSPAVWVSNPAPSDSPVNEVHDDLFVILRINWGDREMDLAEVISTAFSEERVHQELASIGVV